MNHSVMQGWRVPSLAACALGTTIVALGILPCPSRSSLTALLPHVKLNGCGYFLATSFRHFTD
jgi:hypothetical protein